MTIRWALLMPDGSVIRGSGPDAGEGLKLVDLAKQAMHAMVQHRSGPLIFVAGSLDLLWSVQGIVGRSEKQRALGMQALAEGARVWVMPDGWLGIGRSIEAVEKAVRAFTTAQKRIS